MSSQDTNPLRSILRAAADGLGHAAHATRDRLAALIPGDDPAKTRGQVAWESRLATARSDPDAFARGDRIAAELAE
ncbi:hypothetical protein [Antrihabitans stalactiti]|uniref:Uncharacterized protein n=1 Tax=Antrihabitans stalactiti TaxID=2584121 RepID=A0A848KC28_9NOCA|nr:hypothetical protein [Antrihabitans stalactiti]NMN95861.1 hypothetical protein [Antrihabitans stalactiti]